MNYDVPEKVQMNGIRALNSMKIAYAMVYGLLKIHTIITHSYHLLNGSSIVCSQEKRQEVGRKINTFETPRKHRPGSHCSHAYVVGELEFVAFRTCSKITDIGNETEANIDLFDFFRCFFIHLIDENNDIKVAHCLACAFG